MVALARLCLLHAGKLGTGAAMTCNGRGVDYIELAALRRCDECGQMLPMMDHGECPRCWLASPPLLQCQVCHGSGRLDSGDACGYCQDGCVEGGWEIPMRKDGASGNDGDFSRASMRPLAAPDTDNS